MAVVIFLSPKICGHSPNVKFVVMITTKKRLTTMLANPLILILFAGAEGQNRTADTGIFSTINN